MMNLSTKGRYATRIMVNLAQGGGEAKSARVVAEDEELSLDYVEQLIMKLKGAGFVKTIRGKHGGSVLARSADAICVAELLEAMEGKMSVAPCMVDQCGRRNQCSTHSLWEEANEALQGVFGNTTIADLARKRAAAVSNYQI